MSSAYEKLWIDDQLIEEGADGGTVAPEEDGGTTRICTGSLSCRRSGPDEFDRRGHPLVEHFWADPVEFPAPDHASPRPELIGGPEGAPVGTMWGALMADVCVAREQILQGSALSVAARRTNSCL